ncbi:MULTISPECIES: MBL fold metallo-hydrolase [Bacillaceae]|uniref:MBL fold metallo-hydrolase n=1 Tax=Bacillaceae TaxID=186817 RepID=UPI000B9BFAFD|nr:MULTISPECIES: MBL fold metallo-hydrolase [Bacillus]OXT17843.1 Zn-dependent hydrolase [Bacillus sp. OG2]MCK6206471.1 MBL fold metallo-hydrolase [Bacillus infantis]MCP1161100.1 MBL fold metallo-hydrolase [Bacillus infantis]MDT0161204.1 MBL fold metallo-hydrolase [Bacillus sp. AG4(2022)]MDW2879650.1 MBL fold metallo-hydrolase [Bacillus infantis]
MMEQELVLWSDRISYLTPVGPTDRPILMAVSGDKHTLMIDAGNSAAHAKLFLEKLKEAGRPEPTVAAITHWHWDHIFGLESLDIPSIASVDTRVEMEKLVPFKWDDRSLDERVEEGIEIQFCADAIKEEFPQQERPIRISLPDITFKDEMTIDLGGITCVLKQVGGDHAPDSVIIYIKEERIAFLADATAPKMYAPTWRFTAKATLDMLDKIEMFNADTYIISHWKPITKEEYQAEASLLRTLSHLVAAYEGDQDKMKKGLEAFYGRPLTNEEQETLMYFVNGFIG